MGMFDNVKHPFERCPDCDAELKEWQTKDAADDEPYLRLIEVKDISGGGSFYATCLSCRVQICYTLVPRDGYDLVRSIERWDAPTPAA